MILRVKRKTKKCLFYPYINIHRRLKKGICLNIITIIISCQFYTIHYSLNKKSNKTN